MKKSAANLTDVTGITGATYFFPLLLLCDRFTAVTMQTLLMSQRNESLEIINADKSIDCQEEWECESGSEHEASRCTKSPHNAW